VNGFDPRWSPSGDAVYYRDEYRLYRVHVGGEDDIRPGIVETVYEGDFHDSAGSSFALSPDGTRVLVNKAPPSTNILTFVTGWAAEVARAVAPDSN
jgi:hypothetical protein